MTRLFVHVSLGALTTALLCGPATAQTAEADTAAPAEEAAIVVTGSRIARDGFDAPTPLTVMTSDDIAQSAPANLADFMNEMPSIMGSPTPANSNLNISGGTAGVNGLNLRSLGAGRTLVLLDGQRSVPSTVGGVVDVNNFPQSLVKSVEIVTGGASAAYGSDAVSGVVNFILDKDFTGFRANAEAGQTTYSDGRNYRLSLTAGVPFAGGRGHILASAEYANKEGIHGVPRDWNQNGWYIITNPAYAAGNGEPERLVVKNAGLAVATPGGIITNTVLRGTNFGVGGTPSQFDYGVLSSPWMVGGDWESVQVNSNQSLEPSEDRIGVFGRISYDVADNITLFGQVSYNRMESLGWTGVQQNQANITIRSDNAFIPASIRTQLNALNIAQFTMGSTNADLPIRKVYTVRETVRYVVGANGDFDAFGTNMKWDAYYQKGITTTMEMAKDITNNARLALAQDAVFHPVTGQIVCRSTIANPTNGCIPLNRMGIGVASQEALAYVLGDPFRNQRFTQDVAAANLSFNPFSLPAGDVGFAVGVEHRREKVSGSVDPDFQTGWFVGNFLPSFGSYNVTEAYIETLVPIFEGLEFNGAIRGTNYSTSGYVTTWKAGLTWQPIPDIRFRATRSRDIRAPNLGELFQGGSTRTNVLLDPFNGNVSTPFSGTSNGNPNLDPEKADQWGLGAVLTPRFMPGFSMSADFYDIKINGAIASATAQTVIDRCYEGVSAFCASVIRGPNAYGTNLLIYESPFNFATLKAQGIDFEASYRVPLGNISSGLGGDLSVRAMATHYIKNYINDGLSTPTDTAGENSGSAPPDWAYRLIVNYSNDPFSITATGRGISSGVYSNAFVECTSGCPVSTVDNRTIDNNRIAGAFYVDLNLTYKFGVAGGDSQIYFNISNLFNKDPALVAFGPAGSAYATPSTNQSLYDLLGRTFRLGIRFKI